MFPLSMNPLYNTPSMILNISFKSALGKGVNIHNPIKSLFFVPRFRSLAGPQLRSSPCQRVKLSKTKVPWARYEDNILENKASWQSASALEGKREGKGKRNRGKKTENGKEESPSLSPIFNPCRALAAIWFNTTSNSHFSSQGTALTSEGERARSWQEPHWPSEK